MLNKTGFSLIAASLLLAGCGGGGGGGSSTPSASSVGYDGPTAGVVMTDQASADEIAASTISDAVNMDLGDITSGLMKPGASTAPNAGIASLTADMINRSLDLAASAESSTMLAGASQTTTVDCELSGTITFTATASDPNAEVPSPGDSVSMTANNCINSDGSVMNGGFSMVLNSYSDENNMSAGVNFSKFTLSDTYSTDYVLLNGGFTMSMSYNSSSQVIGYRMAGDALLFQKSSGGVIKQAALTQFSLVDTIDASWNFTADHDYTFYSTEIGGYVKIETTTPIFIYYGDFYPSSGVVVITGDGGAKVRVTALDNTSVQFEYDLDADGVFGNGTDPATTTKLWTEI